MRPSSIAMFCVRTTGIPATKGGKPGKCSVFLSDKSSSFSQVKRHGSDSVGFSSFQWIQMIGARSDPNVEIRCGSHTSDDFRRGNGRFQWSDSVRFRRPNPDRTDQILSESHRNSYALKTRRVVMGAPRSIERCSPGHRRTSLSMETNDRRPSSRDVHSGKWDHSDR